MNITPINDYATVSIGISSIVPDDKSNLKALLAKADQALYQAKSQGRNSIAVLS